MKTFTTTIILLILSFARARIFVVDHYDGPKECSDDEKVKTNDYVKMHYTGTIDPSSLTGEKGKKFDSSRDRDEPFSFQIGNGQVIRALDEGLIDICKGAKVTVIAPPEMAYGNQAMNADIPGGATLRFQVRIVDVKTPGPPSDPDHFADMDTDEDAKVSREEFEAFFQKRLSKSAPAGLFEREDKDKDGFISWQEFGGKKSEKPRVTKRSMFNDIDINGSGELNKREIDEYFAKIGKEVPKHLWEVNDENEDWLISFEEFAPEIPDPFKDLDFNGDDLLDHDELEKYFQDTYGKATPADMWAKEDLDRDGFISRDEFYRETIDKGTDEHMREITVSLTQPSTGASVIETLSEF